MMMQYQGQNNYEFKVVENDESLGTIADAIAGHRQDQGDALSNFSHKFAWATS
jgi:hypothetical protein